MGRGARLPRRRWAVGLVAAAALLSIGAAADEPALQVAVIPGAVTLLTDESARVEVVINNPTPVAVVATSLDPVAPPRVTASAADDSFPATIAPHSSLIVPLDVVAHTELSEAQVGVIVTYRASAEGSPTRSVTTPLTVSATSTAAPALTFLVVPDALNDGEQRRATVLIDNPSARAFTELSLTALDGDDVFIEMPGDPVEPFTTCADGAGLVCLPLLQPGTSATVELRLRADESVRTGSQQVGLLLTASPDVSSTTRSDADPPAISATATHEVTLTVFGVDAISPFGLGALFLVPGVLAVVMFVLGNAVYPRTTSVPDEVDLKDLRQVPFVVSVSAILYALVFAVFGRNLIHTVSTGDVALLVTSGALLGLIAWAILAVIHYRAIGRKRFRLDDEPPDVLRRLDARGASLTLPSFASGSVTYVHLGPAEQGKALAAPQIAFHFTAAAQGAAHDNARSAVSSAIGRGEIQPVLEAMKGGLVRLRWVTASGMRTFDEATSLATGEANVLKEEALP